VGVLHITLPYIFLAYISFCYLLAVPMGTGEMFPLIAR